MLQAKIDSGAARAITQFFFDNKAYFRFIDRVRARGITIPIIPGIIPIHDFQRIASFAVRAGVRIPVWLYRRFDGLQSDPHTHRLAAAAFAAEQVLDLVDQGITTFHFYTLNRADLVYAICHMLGLRPRAQQKPHAPLCAADRTSERDGSRSPIDYHPADAQSRRDI